uniref:NADH dehydrogenase subunit 6 n=1 Tax=Sphaeroma serratum TaxID=96875 RepID=E3SXB7_SPHSR|nr:NADH dehydrogenase subunit 6 [Sphaeroma serratum]
MALSTLLMGMSFMLIWVFSPYWMLGILVIQALFTGLYLSSMNLVWFSYILFLTVLGGLLVIFSYISSLISEEIMDGAVIGYLVSTGIASSLFLGGVYLFKQGDVLISNQLTQSADNISIVVSLFSGSGGAMYVFVVLYLLLALVCVVNSTKSKMGPLRLRG